MDARIPCNLLAPMLAFGLAGPVSAQTHPGHFDDIGQIFCAEGSERYLPGDYYFCAANKALQAGNAKKAMAMYEESAGWGDKRAMFNLALLLLRGEGVARNEPLGLAWLALSAEREKDRLQREVLAGEWRKATPELRDAANALWNAMKLQYADRHVLPRAQQRYERETRDLRIAVQLDPSMRIEIAGIDRPMGGTEAMRLLDDAAADTILRPKKGPQGDVDVGRPEVVRDTAPTAKP